MPDTQTDKPSTVTLAAHARRGLNTAGFALQCFQYHCAILLAHTAAQCECQTLETVIKLCGPELKSMKPSYILFADQQMISLWYIHDYTGFKSQLKHLSCSGNERLGVHLVTWWQVLALFFDVMNPHKQLSYNND